MRNHAAKATALLLAAAATTPAVAGTWQGIHPLLSERFVVSAMGFWPEYDATLSVDDPDGDVGTGVDMDDLFGSGKDFKLALSGAWRFSERSRLTFEGFSVGTDGKAVIKETIDWGDLEFEVGARVKGDISWDVYRFFYGYNLLRSEKGELGIGAGLHLMNLQASLSGQASIDGIPVAHAKESVDIWAPLPNIGAYGSYALSPRWLVGAQLDWFSANIGDYDGSLWHVGGFVQYQVTEHFGVGAAYRHMSIDVSIDKKGDWRGGADSSYSGPVLFLTASF